eukprot:COSAG03_NODE_4068_length_1696_cov_2.336665_2_plen_251_part_00
MGKNACTRERGASGGSCEEGDVPRMELLIRHRIPEGTLGVSLPRTDRDPAATARCLSLPSSFPARGCSPPPAGGTGGCSRCSRGGCVPRTRAPSRRTSIRSSSRAPTLLYTGTPRCVLAKTTGPAQSVAATSRSISALNAFPASASALTASHRARLAHSVESVVPHGHVTPGRSPAGGVASSPACWCGILEHAGGATDTLAAGAGGAGPGGAGAWEQAPQMRAGAQGHTARERVLDLALFAIALSRSSSS